MNKKNESHSIENTSGNVEKNGEPMRKPHVEHNVEASSPTSDKTQIETTEVVVDIPVSDTQLNDKLKEMNDAYDDSGNDNSHRKEPEVQDKSNGEAEEDDDQPLANLLEKIAKNMSKGTKIKLKM